MRWLTCLLAAVAGGADFVGSDLLDGPVAAGLAAVAGPDSADFAGTLPGRRAFVEGRVAAFAGLRRAGEPAPEPKGAAAVEFHLASVVIVVATHDSNRVERLTLENLADAFAKDARSPARNWNDLQPDARSELLTPAVCSPPGTLVLEAFQGLVLEGQPFRPDVRLRVEPDLAADLLAARAGSLILLPRLPAGRARVLPIADGRPGRSTTAYRPDEANVHNGDYPLQLPLILNVRSDRLASLRPGLRWLFSDEAAAILVRQGLTPAPAAARARLVQRLDTR